MVNALIYPNVECFREVTGEQYQWADLVAAEVEGGYLVIKNIVNGIPGPHGLVEASIIEEMLNEVSD